MASVGSMLKKCLIMVERDNIMKQKSDAEIESINQVIKYVFENPRSLYGNFLSSYEVPVEEDYGPDIKATTIINIPLYVEVKTTEEPFFSAGTINPYFKLDNYRQPVTFENTVTATSITTGNCYGDRNAYSTTIPEEYKNKYYWIINAAQEYNKTQELLMTKKCKLVKMLNEQWAFAYVLKDGVLFFGPEKFEDALGPFVRVWCRHTENIKDKKPKEKSWELKRLIDLEKGTFIPFN